MEKSNMETKESSSSEANSLTSSSPLNTSPTPQPSTAESLQPAPTKISLNRSKLEQEEYCLQFQEKLESPLPSTTPEKDIPLAGQEQEGLPDELPAKTSSTDSWAFQCDAIPLESYVCNNEQSLPEENQRENDIGAGLMAALGVQSGGSEVDLLEQPDAGPSPSAVFINRHPSLVTSPPNLHRIPHNEILNAIGGFTNMFLAHEIAVNEDFKLEDFIPKEDTLTSRISVQMKKAFWDMFEEQLTASPPNYRCACGVLKDIKNEMLNLLLPHNRSLREQITQVIDLDRIQFQLDNDMFESEDIEGYVEFIIDFLSKICCPVRDDDVSALRGIQTQGIIATFKAILATIEKMKLDMANFLVMDARPAIVKQVVQYERNKFAEFLELEYRMNDDGLKATRLWLNRHRAENRETRVIIAKAFSELLNYSAGHPWPETMILDVARLQQLEVQIRRLGIIGACVLSIGSVCQGLFGGNFATELREKSKKHLKLLLSVDDMKTDDSLKEAMFRLGEEACSLANTFVQDQLQRNIDETERQRIRDCVTDVIAPDHKIRLLIMRRLLDYVEEVTLAQYAYPVTMPPGLAIIHFEVSGTISHFYRIINHNRRVYGDIYRRLVRGYILPPKYMDELNGEWDPNFCHLIKKLREKPVDEELYERMRNEDIQRIQDAEAKLPDGIK